MPGGEDIVLSYRNVADAENMRGHLISAEFPRQNREMWRKNNSKAAKMCGLHIEAWTGLWTNVVSYRAICSTVRTFSMAMLS
jgi:hypothetical protein